MKKYRRDCVLAPLFKLLEASMDLAVPLIVASIINSGIPSGDTGFIAGRFAILAALAVAGMLFAFTAQWFAARASVGFASDVRQALFDHSQSLSFAAADRLGDDTLITRLTSDINQVQNGVNLALRLLLRSPFIVFGAMVMAFTIDARCASVFAVAIPVLSVLVFGVMLGGAPLYTKAQGALDKLLGITRENITGARVIRAFNAQQRETDAFDAQNDRLTRINERVGRISAVLNPGTYLLINIATIVLIQQGALRVSLGALRQGDVVALYNYMAQILVELIKLASLIITINKAMACGRRIQSALDLPQGMAYGARETADAGADEAVRFDDVSFAYEGAGAEAISHISFAIRRGGTVGVIGGTGSGKSTLVNLIPRFYDATGGRVSVFGADVRDYRKGALTELTGVVPQQALLFAGSIRENMLWGNDAATDADINAALEKAQALDVVEAKGGLDAQLEQRGRNLSGGQRQRLSIARALVKRPRILILDDSASALDMATDLRLRRALRGLEGDTTVFIVSQRASSVRDADLILVLEDGALAGSGTHAELMRDCAEYREIYYSQYPDERPEMEASK